MAITRAQLANRDALAAWLQANAVPGLFKSVTYESSVIACTDDNDNTVLEIKDGGDIYAYRAAGNAINTSESNNMIGANTIDLIACDNGIIIENAIGANAAGQLDVLITKTNSGKVAIIWGYSMSSKTTGRTSGIQHVAWGDSPTLATTTAFTPEAGQQTVLAPFATNAEIGAVSYTPAAGYLPMHTLYQSGVNKFILGADTYITNGYWAIKDGGAA